VQSVDELNRATSAHIAASIIPLGTMTVARARLTLMERLTCLSWSTSKAPGQARYSLSPAPANDGEEGPVTSFRLESVPLGTDADGKVTTAPEVVQVNVVTNDGSNLKDNSTKALESLERGH
jgi:hypothetical protein